MDPASTHTGGKGAGQQIPSRKGPRCQDITARLAVRVPCSIREATAGEYYYWYHQQTTAGMDGCRLCQRLILSPRDLDRYHGSPHVSYSKADYKLVTRDVLDAGAHLHRNWVELWAAEIDECGDDLKQS
jgi:hypothetical protein